MKTSRITTLEELRGVAHEVLSQCTSTTEASVIGLYGDLGVGKTAFTKELAKLLQIPHEITSPTFVIMKSYDIPAHAQFKTLVHIDAYRIESLEEMRVLKLEELLKDPTQLICVEWPERIGALIPSSTHSVQFVLENDGTREVTVGS